MNPSKNEFYYDRLRQRRDEIMMTREHLRKEQQTMDENKDWVDRAAYESRIGLLDNLAEWYLKETARIDDALIRIAEGKYGFCLACHAPIETQRLDAMPDVAFCSGCQESREELTNA